jgi:LysR family transcriptional regulator (chromosome initiation inhibitor)
MLAAAWLAQWRPGQPGDLDWMLPGTERAPVQMAIAVNADSLATWFPQVLWPLMREHRLAIEVVIDDQDHTLARLARGEVIGCISTQATPASGFIAEPLGSMEYRCYATQSFAAKHFPQGISVRDALKAPVVLFNRKDALHDEFLAGIFGFRIDKYTKHYLPATATLLDGVAAGIGYGLVPSVQVAGHHAHGLIDLAPQRPVAVALYWHHWAAEPPQSRRVTERVLKVAAQALLPPAPATASRSELLCSLSSQEAVADEGQA